jgi:hypothetical protein
MHQMLASHPYLIVGFIGVAVIVGVLTNLRNGLLQHLPADVREFLAEMTWFDCLRDDIGITNASRRWLRILLLCYERTPEQIAVIIQGLDGTFLHSILRKNILDTLPEGLHAMLVPRPEVATTKAELINGNGHGINGSVPVVAPEPGVGDLSEHAIHRMVREKDKAKLARITEPSLDPVLEAVVMGPVIEAKRVVESSVLKCLQWVSYGAAAAQLLAAAVSTFGTPWALPALRDLASNVVARSSKVISKVSDGTRLPLVTLVSLMGAGTCVLFGSLAQGRLQRLRPAMPVESKEE